LGFFPEARLRDPRPCPAHGWRGRWWSARADLAKLVTHGLGSSPVYSGHHQSLDATEDLRVYGLEVRIVTPLPLRQGGSPLPQSHWVPVWAMRSRWVKGSAIWKRWSLPS